MKTDFWKSGHTPTLFSAFLYFDLSFMAWVMLGPLAVQIATSLGLGPAQKGFMVALPILSGALLRIVMGLLVDHIKPRRAGIIGQLLVIAALAVAWGVGVQTFPEVLVLGLFLGIAGASFAVALPLASRWYPPKHQGKALGIAGAGNSGTTFAALFMPTLAAWYGWQSVFGLVTLPLLVALIVYIIFAKDSPDCPPPKALSEYLAVLKDRDAWWFMFFYGVTFGGFSGLSSSLVLYFHDQYGLGAVEAGYLTAACVFAGSLVRPIGGILADRFGGVRMLSALYWVAAGGLVVISFGLPGVGLAFLAFIVVIVALGAGNGAVFQLVPQRFLPQIGSITGLVGCAGGIGGFYLASSLGLSKQWTGSYQLGFLMFAGLAVLALAGIAGVKGRWRRTWGASALASARI